MQAWEVIRSYAESASHCQSMPSVPGGDGCSLSPPPDTQDCPLSSPVSEPLRLHFQQIFNYFLSASFHLPVELSRQGRHSNCHLSPGRLCGLGTSFEGFYQVSANRNASSRPPSHQLINRMYLMNFLPEPSRKWLFGASREIPGML